MSLVGTGVTCALVFAVLAFGGCGQCDYQGGGRRNDLSSITATGIGLNAGGASNAGARDGSAGALAIAGGGSSAGFADCGASGEDEQGLATGCTP